MVSDRSSPSDGRRNGLPTAEPADLIKQLCRGLSRLAVAAQGIDAGLDEQLARLRQILRSDVGGSPDLGAVIAAIDDRIKHVDEEREGRADALQRALEQLAGQLLALKPEPPLARELKAFLRNLGPELDDGDELPLLIRLCALQEQVLAGAPRQNGGLFARWFGGERHVESARDDGPDDTPTRVPVAGSVPISVEPEAEPVPDVALAPEPAVSAVMEPSAVGAPAEEPPFSRLSASVCAVLDELLRQVDPPPIAADNHRQAREQVERGLNWYELVSVLEQISVVVLAALERDRDTFQEFLLELNRRLSDAHQVLQRSQQTNIERRQADAALGETVRDQVAAIQARVSAATELDQLKAEVSTRLDSIVSAMDQHQHQELSRQHALEQQLTLLTERVRDMEAQSAQVEARFEEQRRLALLDTLTQMPNRQAYEERLQQEHQRWLRYQRPLALVVCDVDNFKSINDSFGHSAGDKVLRILAKTLRTRLRQADFVARFGGEEFVALMPETSLDEALQTLDSIRAAIAECPFHFRSQPVSITLSAGIASFEPGDEPETVFERADAALYRAKQAGRNRCMIAEPMPR